MLINGLSKQRIFGTSFSRAHAVAGEAKRIVRRARSDEFHLTSDSCTDGRPLAPRLQTRSCALCCTVITHDMCGGPTLPS